MNKIAVIGVGADGPQSLRPQALETIYSCDLLYGGKRILSSFDGAGSRQVVIGSNLTEVAHLLKNNLSLKQVVLATGDPNFFGIANFLYRYVGKEYMEVQPNVSSIQLAFARIGETWHDAFLASVHGRSAKALPDWVRAHRKVALLTDEWHHPAALAGQLIQAGMKDVIMVVAENLGLPEEKVTSWRLEEVAEERFSPLNVVIFLRANPLSPSRSRSDWPLGIPDSAFVQRKP